MRENTAVGICAILLALTPACSRYTTKDGTVSIQQTGKDAGSMTVTGKDGVKMELNTGSGAKMPGDYPKDVPVYDGVKIVMSTSAPQKNAHVLVLESGDPADKISDFYKKGLEANGWKTEGTMNMAEMNMYTASKENRQVVVQVMDGKDKRTINQTVSDK